MSNPDVIGTLDAAIDAAMARAIEIELRLYRTRLQAEVTAKRADDIEIELREAVAALEALRALKNGARNA